jgi:hypothetical protein
MSRGRTLYHVVPCVLGWRVLTDEATWDHATRDEARVRAIATPAWIPSGSTSAISRSNDVGGPRGPKLTMRQWLRAARPSHVLAAPRPKARRRAPITSG